MSWKSGSALAEESEAAIMPHADTIGADALASLGKKIASAFRDMDCDTLYHCAGFIGDADNLLDHDAAPDNPKPGDTYIDRCGDTFTFNGKRWNWTEE